MKELIARYKIFIGNLEWNIKQGNAIGQRLEMAKKELDIYKEVVANYEAQPMYSREQIEDLVQQLKDYTRESRSIIGFDEREPKEFVDIFLDTLSTPKKYAQGAVEQQNNPKG